MVNEKTARAFAMRYGADIYALRIGNVIEPHEYDCSPASSPTRRRASAMPGAISTPAISARSCIWHPEGRARLSGLQRHQRHHHRQHPDPRSAEQLLSRNVPITRELGEFEAPLSNRKTREVLGFKEAHDWRKYVKAG